MLLFLAACGTAGASSLSDTPTDAASAVTAAPAPSEGSAGGPTLATAPVDPSAAVDLAPLDPLEAEGPGGVYSHTMVGQMSPAVSDALALVYVPSNDEGSVTVIDPATMQVIDGYYIGRLIQHVVPSWDLTTLYATASNSNQLVPIDPSTGKPGEPLEVAAPYNLYFTPDGTKAVVMAERLDRIDFYDRSNWQLLHSTPTPCTGVNHADWSSDGTWFIATCEFSGDVIKIDTATGAILNTLALGRDAKPQDLRIAADGSKFYVADMNAGGLWILDDSGTTVTGFIETGVGTHAIYPSRDATLLYVTNRGRSDGMDTNRPSRPGEGSISVVDPATDTVVDQWEIEGGGSPDMGGVSADGSLFWVSGRYDDVVYAFDTSSGELIARIDVPSGPHGLSLFPQPGRYSLGHTGNFR